MSRPAPIPPPARPARVRLAYRLLGLSLFGLSSLGLAGCQPACWTRPGRSARRERTILIDSLGIMLAIVVPTIVATLAFAWWFRAGNPRASYLPDWAFSGRIELVVWSIPLLTIMFLGGVAWIGSHELDPAKPLAVRPEAARGAGRVARLEVAVHLPGAGRRQRQPLSSRPGRRCTSR